MSQESPNNLRDLVDASFLKVFLKRRVGKKQMDDYEGALEDLYVAMEIDPHDADIMGQRGLVKGDMGKFREALVDLDYTHELKSFDYILFFYRAFVKWMSNDYHGALDDFNKADELHPCDGCILKLRGQVKITLHDYQGAFEDLDVACKLDPCDAFILQQRGEAKYLLHEYEGALNDLDRANELEPKNAYTLRWRGMVKRTMFNYQGALQDLDEANKLESNDSITLRERGITKNSMRDLKGALQDFNRANELEPNNAITLGERGISRNSMDDYEGALQDLNIAHVLDPNDANILKGRAFAKRMLQDLQGAANDIERAHQLDPNDVCILLCRAHLKRVLRDYHGALEDLDKAYILEPDDHVVILKARATMKHLLHDFEGSLLDLNMAYELEPHNVFILKERVALKVMMKDYQGAIEDLGKAHELDPDKFTKEMQKGVKQMSKEYLKAMAELLQKALHHMNALGEYDIIGRYNNLSSSLSFLLELTKIVFQLYTYYAVIVVFVFKYLMGYVEKGQWGTYSNGCWEFRATYICIELRLGAYPFQKFREVASPSQHTQARQQIRNMLNHLSVVRPRGPSQLNSNTSTQTLHDAVEPRFSGIRYRPKKRGKEGVRMKYEPWISIKSENQSTKVYLGEVESLEVAVRYRDVAQFCLGKQGPFNVDPKVFVGLAPIPHGHHSPHEIRSFVRELAKEVNEEAFQNAYREAWQTAGILAESGYRPNPYYTHSNHQNTEQIVSHQGHDIGELDAQYISSSGNEEHTLTSQAEFYNESQFEDGFADLNDTTCNDLRMTPRQNQLNLDATILASLAQPPKNLTSELHVQNVVTSEEEDAHNDKDVSDQGTSFNSAFYACIAPSSDLWRRCIIINAPLGIALVRHNHTQGFVIEPPMVSTFSTLKVFITQGWNVSVDTYSTSSKTAVALGTSNRVGTSSGDSQSFIRILRTGSHHDVALSPAMRLALEEIDSLPEWTAFY